jgi:hypothetical protein
MDKGDIIRNIIGEDDDYEENEKRLNKEYNDKKRNKKKFFGI